MTQRRHDLLQFLELTKNAPPPSNFDGFGGTHTLEGWIGEIDIRLTMFHAGEDVKVDYAALYLRGRAASWYANYMSKHPNVKWADMVTGLRRLYGDEFGLMRV